MQSMRPISSSVDWLAIVDEFEEARDIRIHEGVDYWIADERSFVNRFIEKQFNLPDDFSDFTGQDDVPF